MDRRVTRLALTFLAILAASSIGKSTLAQSRTDIINYLFKEAPTDLRLDPEPNGSPWFNFNGAIVSEDACVVTIQFKKPAFDRDDEYRDAVVRVDFNRMIAKTAIFTARTRGFLSSNGVEVAGQKGFISVKTTSRKTGAPLNYESLALGLSIHISGHYPMKFPVAFSHFITNACPGTDAVL